MHCSDRKDSRLSFIMKKVTFSTASEQHFVKYCCFILVIYNKYQPELTYSWYCEVYVGIFLQQNETHLCLNSKVLHVNSLTIETTT